MSIFPPALAYRMAKYAADNRNKSLQLTDISNNEKSVTETTCNPWCYAIVLSMDYPIIDIHTHLGDVLYPDGGTIIEDGKKRSKMLLDPLLIFERRNWEGFRGARLFEQRAIKAGMERSRIATRKNLQNSMLKNGIGYCAVMSVPPAVTFSDLKSAYEKNDRLLPFTSVDYLSSDSLGEKFSADVAAGARGLKLHPILQRVPLNSPETMAAIEAFAPFDLPILFHSGVSEYYVNSAEKKFAQPEYGNIEPVVDVVSAFPNVNFIVGHAGLDGVDAVIELLQDFTNVYVDISFQGINKVEKLIETFGAERVLYASDWPWGKQEVSLRIIKQICIDNPVLKKLLLYENAARLLKIT